MDMSDNRKNNSLKEIGQILKSSNKILLFTHINMDGDTLGSAVALCHTLRNMGKEAWILIEDRIPEFIRFMDREYCTSDLDIIQEPDICLAIDCGDMERFPKRKEKYLSAGQKGCIDHHMTTEGFGDFNYVDPQAAATGEIIFDLLEAMGEKPDREAAEALFAAITTDTGNFQYSNTTKKTHEIAGALYDVGVRYHEVSEALYQNNKVEKLKLQTRALSDMEMLLDGKIAVCGVNQAMLSETGCTLEDAEGLVEIMRNLAGVEVSGFIKEQAPGLCKVSMRSKGKVNVAEISAKNGGGGHARAAGFSMKMPYQEALDRFKEILKEAF